MKQLTKEQAVVFFDNKCYKNMTCRQRAEFQIEQDRLCMPFVLFHEALEETLNRTVFIHEFIFNIETLKKELYSEKEPPTFEEMMSLIPKEVQSLFL